MNFLPKKKINLERKVSPTPLRSNSINSRPSLSQKNLLACLSIVAPLLRKVSFPNLKQQTARENSEVKVKGWRVEGWRWRKSVDPWLSLSPSVVKRKKEVCDECTFVHSQQRQGGHDDLVREEGVKQLHCLFHQTVTPGYAALMSSYPTLSSRFSTPGHKNLMSSQDNSFFFS